MANTVLLKRSGTANSAPTSLSHGELAINYADAKLFWKNSSNTISSFTLGSYAAASHTHVEAMLAVHGLDGSAFEDGADNTFIYTDVDSDPYEQYDTSTGEFTIPTGKGGIYLCQISLLIDGGYPLTSVCNPNLFIDYGDARVFFSTSTFTVADGSLRFSGVAVTQLSAGQVVYPSSYLGDFDHSGITWSPNNDLAGFNAFAMYKL